MLKCFWRCSAMALVLELFFSGSRHPAEYRWTTPAASSVPPNVNLAAALTWTTTTWAIQRDIVSKETNNLRPTNLTRHCLINTFPNKPEISIISGTVPNPKAGDTWSQSVIMSSSYITSNLWQVFINLYFQTVTLHFYVNQCVLLTQQLIIMQHKDILH